MKFKVWDKSTNSWLDFNKYKAVLGNDGKIYNAHRGLYANDDWIPVFSTGTHDKNGAELFDGDIVPSVSGVNLMIIHDNSEYAGWKFEYLFGKAKGMRISAHSTLLAKSEKIGNRFENPELLEGNV